MRINDTERIKHIRDTARELLSYMKGREKSDIHSDTLFSKAVLYSLLVIGEAAYGISDEFKEKHPNIDWRRIVGMRNRFIHGYFDINLDIVWDTVIIHVPELLKQLVKL